jgi:hypothetical protein
MSKPPYRILRFVLALFSLLGAVGGLLMIFGSKPFMIRLLLRPAGSEVSTLLLLMTKEMGGVLLMLGVLFYFAFRDPVRNVAIIDATIVGLCVLAFTPLLALYTLDVRSLYPSFMIWGRSLARLAMAALLYSLRPCKVPSA